MISQKSLNLTPKQTLILFFIETGFADTDYKLVKHLDRSAFFPSQLSANLSPLFEHNLIEISGWLSNSDPWKYTIKKQGIEYLDQNLRRAELMSFADTYSHKDFIMQVLPVLLKKRIADGKILDGE